MRRSILCLLACSASLSGAAAGFSGAPLPEACALHLLGSGLAALALGHLLPAHLRSRAADLFLLSLCVLLPGVGAPGVLLALEMLRRLPGDAGLELRRLEIAPQDPGLSPAARPLSQARGMLLSPSARRRVLGLQATRGLDTRGAVQLLNAALRDPADDVRLLAHALLEQREKQLDAQIRKLSQGQPGPEAHRALAHLHFELADTGIAQGPLFTRALESALLHAAQGPADDLRLRELEVRACLKLGQVERALGLLGRLPGLLARRYAAEISFLRREALA